MMLVPTTGVLEIVLKAYEADPVGAEELVRLGLFEALGDQVDAMRGRIDAAVSEQALTTIAKARTALEHQVVKGETVGATRRYLDILEEHFTEVSKSPLDWIGWNQRYPEHLKDREGKWAKNRDRGQIASYDAIRSLTNADKKTARRLSSAIPTSIPTGAAENWNRVSTVTDSERDRRSYRRMAMTGSALAAVSAPGSPGHTVGQLAGLVGNIGPEAEKVLGPGIARTAYRYRGTERRPDAGLVRSMEAMNAKLDEHAQMQPQQYDQDVAHISSSHKSGKGDVVEAAIATNRNHLEQSDDQRGLATRGDVAVQYLSSKLPDARRGGLTDISLKAGELPPSQGVIIDANGDVVTEAMGFNGDHYLPFNLKNLASLRGGQYVRTRATGGLTSEDIYTGLMTGARQVQVVSNSGVFTLEFDPDLRGGRRYSDKARRMVGRYQKLLDAIEYGDLYRQDVSPTRQLELRREAAERGFDKDSRDRIFTELLEEERSSSELGFDEIEEAADEETDEQVRQYRANTGKVPSRGEIARIRNDVLGELRETANENMVRRYRLDGEGYQAALGALSQEFPYYVRAPKYVPLPEYFDEHRMRPREGQPRHPGRDRGYVEPGALRPSAGRMGRGTVEPGRLLSPNLPGRSLSPTRAVASGERPANQPGAGTQSPPSAPRSDAVVRFTPHPAEPLAGQPGERMLKKGIAAVVEPMEPDWYGKYLQASLPNADDSEDVARGDGPLGFVWWVGENMADEQGGVPGWLVTASPASQKAYLNGLRKIVEKMPEKLPDEFDRDATAAGLAAVEAGLALKTPFVAGDVTDPPDERMPRPLAFGEIEDLGIREDNYTGWLQAARASRKTQDIAEEATTYDEDWSTKEIVEDIRAQQEVLEALSQWGKAMAGGEDDARPAQILVNEGYDANDPENRKAAVKAFRRPEETEEYQALRAKQMAWAWVHGKRLAAQLRGGGATPKASGPELAKSASGWSPRSGRSDRVRKQQPSPFQLALREVLRSDR